MKPGEADGSDPYSRIDYRRLIAWPERIRREAPFLEEVLGRGPDRRLLDLGCGTGEHSRYLASQGFEVVGVDRSESMLAKAEEAGSEPRVRFVRGDLKDLGSLVEGSFDGAISLGNTLPHLSDRGELDAFLVGLRAHLRQGAPFLLQILNYTRFEATGERNLPLSFRPGDDGEIVFLRLVELREDGTVLFVPSTLRYRPEADPPLELVRARRVVLRGWRRAELEEALGAAGFRNRKALGSYAGEPFEEEASRDLVLISR